jgi:cytochrome c biogenesis protein CcmG, thiol:disulfide interchange protein DsbE
MKKFLIPLGLFFCLVAFLAVGLQRDPREIPSPLVDKPAPDFHLATLEGDGHISPADMRGQVWMLNVWATWCVSCREEHPVLVAFTQQHKVTIVGLSYKEIQPQDEMAKAAPDVKLAAARERSQVWLKRHGNPYTTVGFDLDGRTGIQYGVYGVPETYIIDKQGIIRYKHVGPVTPRALADKILPMLEALNKS